jgi:hypothetical protein
MLTLRDWVIFTAYVEELSERLLQLPVATILCVCWVMKKIAYVLRYIQKTMSLYELTITDHLNICNG